MKYRVLLAGKNRAIVDDFFRTMDDRFQCLTTSNRSMDMANHMELFKPHAFIYCFASESKDDIIRLAESFDAIAEENREVILIGDPEPCEIFNRRKPEYVKMVLHRPITANTIKDKLIKYFEKNKIGVEPSKQDEEMESLMAMAKSFQEKEEKPETVQHDTKATAAAAAAEILKKQQMTPDISAIAQTVEVKAAEPIVEEVVVEETEQAVIEPMLAEPVEMKHILVIDDDLMMLRLVKAELKDRYNVATAVSGKIGMKFLERRTTDLILLDYEMPEENGAEVLKKLRANPMTRNIPVVFLTGMNNREIIKQLVAMKPQGYLLKPIKCEQLVQTIQSVIG